MSQQLVQFPNKRPRRDSSRAYDAILVLSFGGPESPADVMPFLKNVTRGRNIPVERLVEVAAHYHHFVGISPINGQNRALIAALEAELAEHDIPLPVYFGNRNWYPLLEETVGHMRADGVRHVLTFVTSAFSSYSGCRQYLDDLERAAMSADADRIEFDKLRVFFNHPGFIEPMAARLREALTSFPVERQPGIAVVFTAHSISLTMARNCAYERQLHEACRLVAGYAAVPQYRLAWQSRSGPSQAPWLEPDILGELDALHQNGARDVVVVPIGFLSDHLEVLYDLDVEAQAHAANLGMTLLRVPTIGVDPVFVAMIRELIQERLTDEPVRRFLGTLGPGHDSCPGDCCAFGRSVRPAPGPTPA